MPRWNITCDSYAAQLDCLLSHICGFCDEFGRATRGAWAFPLESRLHNVHC